jgi:hypothetical protein
MKYGSEGFKLPTETPEWNVQRSTFDTGIIQIT